MCTNKLTTTLAEHFHSVLQPSQIIQAPEIRAQFTKNVTEFEREHFPLVLQPKTHQEVAAILQIAQDQAIQVHVYSSGKNWGLGSKLAVQHKSIAIDLTQLNQVVTIDETLGIAIIEAGVTQAQFAQHLNAHQIPFKFPVTGSAQNTSIIGNMMDRGASLFFGRRQRLIGLEVALPNGEIIRTGHWQQKSRDEAPFYAPGMGPDLKDLFVQSNFGIITAAAIQLLPVQHGQILVADLDETHVEATIDTLRQLQQQKLIDEGFLVTNKNDPRTTSDNQFNYNGTWTAIASVSGPLHTAAQTKVQSQLATYCHTQQWFETQQQQAAAHPYHAIIANMYQGIPSDYSLHTMAQLHNTTIQQDTEVDTNLDFPGMAVALFAVPIHGARAMAVVQTLRRVSEALQVQTFYNFASLDDLTFEGFFRVYFDRKDPQAVARAHTWNQQAHRAVREELGILPYRLNVNQHAAYFEHLPTSYAQLLKQLKQSLDPNQILAKDKYTPMF